MELKIPTPPNFNFRRTILSHGWYGLLPFSLDSEKYELTRVIDLDPKPPVTIVMSGKKGHVRVIASRSLTKATSQKSAATRATSCGSTTTCNRSTSPSAKIRSFHGSVSRALDACCARPPSSKTS
jgi:hypothetical protein